MTLASYITQGQQLFGRIYSLTLSNNAGTASVWGNELPGQSPLRVTFSIERTNDGPGTSKITVFNLSPTSRNALQVGTQLVLRAGYAGNMSLQFAGAVSEVKTGRDGPDIATEMTCTEGLNFTNFAILHQSYAPGTPLYRVFQDLAQAMSVDISQEKTLFTTGVVAGLPNETLTQGLVVDGAVSKTLTQLCRPRNLKWSIVNRQLRIRPTAHFDTMAVQVLSREAGLINVPAFNAEKLTFSCLLLPNIFPGGLVQLAAENQNVNGNYLICKTKTDGDTHGSAWNVDCEASVYTGSLASIAATSSDHGYAQAVLGTV